MYEWTLKEGPVTIAIQREVDDYKGGKKWITRYSKVRLDDLCWNKLWNQTYDHMVKGSKFKRVVYCVQKFPISLEEKKKLLGWDFTVDGPENETY